MAQVTEAIFQDGVLRPLGKLDLRERQRVLLTVEPLGSASVLSPSWFFHLWLLRSHRSPRFPRSA
jgi:hypothetical protein